MKKNQFLSFFGALCVGLLVIWGCQGGRPVGPAKYASLTVRVPAKSHGNLLGSTANELLFNVSGPGMAAISGTSGIIASASVTGTIDFSVNVPIGPSRTLAVQLNDAPSGDPLAIGATQFDLGANQTVNDVDVELGSVTRTCYATYGTFNYLGFSYGFDNDSMSSSACYGCGYNIIATNDPTNNPVAFHLVDAAGNTGGAINADTIAYMGNGDLVNFAYVPADASFSYDSAISKQNSQYVPLPPEPTPTPIVIRGGGGVGAGLVSVKAKASLPSFFLPDIQIGDVYCIKLLDTGGYAWIQITDSALYGSTGPSFRFRINKKLQYYHFDPNDPNHASQTSSDVASSCSGGY